MTVPGRPPYTHTPAVVRLVARTEPDSPRGPTQRYRRTGAGRRLLARIAGASGGARENSQEK